MVIGYRYYVPNGTDVEYVKSDFNHYILIEFEKEQIPGLMSFARMENELTKMIGRKVDLRTPAEISKYFRNDVLKKARVEYAI